MAKYAVKLERCRSILFAEYFNNSHSSSYCHEALPFSRDHCRQCDNCTRDQSENHREDITLEVCQICCVVHYINKMNGRITLIQLGDSMRGIGTPLSTIIKNRQVDQHLQNKDYNVPSEISTLEFIGGKLKMKKEQVENIILHLILQGYLEEQFVATAYTVNNYIKVGNKSRELLSHQGEIINKSIPTHLKITIASISSSNIKSNRKTVKKKTDKVIELDDNPPVESTSKRKKAFSRNIVSSDSHDEVDSHDEEEVSTKVSSWVNKNKNDKKRKKMYTEVDNFHEID